MNELDHDQLIAIEEFARGLRECFSNKLNTTKDEMVKITLSYAQQVLDIHLSLAQIKFDRYATNMAVHYGK